MSERLAKAYELLDKAADKALRMYERDPAYDFVGCCAKAADEFGLRKWDVVNRASWSPRGAEQAEARFGC